MECTNNAGLQSHLRRNASCYNLPSAQKRYDEFVYHRAGVDVPLTKLYQDKVRHTHQTGTWKGNKKE